MRFLVQRRGAGNVSAPKVHSSRRRTNNTNSAGTTLIANELHNAGDYWFRGTAWIEDGLSGAPFREASAPALLSSRESRPRRL